MTDCDGYKEVIQIIWDAPIWGGGVSYILWHKLERLQNVLYKMNKPLILAKQNIVKAEDNLTKAQNKLAADRMNGARVTKVKICI